MATRARKGSSRRTEDKENEYGRTVRTPDAHLKELELPARRQSTRPRAIVNYADDSNDVLLRRALALSAEESHRHSTSSPSSSDSEYMDSSDSNNVTSRLSEAESSDYEEDQGETGGDEGEGDDSEEDGEGEMGGDEGEGADGEGEGEDSDKSEEAGVSGDLGEEENEDCVTEEPKKLYHMKTRRSDSSVKHKQDTGKYRHKTEEQAEKYFSSQYATPRSRKSGGRKSLSKMDRETILDMLDTTHNAYRDSIGTLHQMYRDLYQYWLFQISQGFNILLYGVGSKRTILEEFCTTHLKGAWHVVIDGCYPNLALKSILSNILTEVLDCSTRISQPILQCQQICDTLCEQDDECQCSELFLVIHNIDGQSLRDVAVQIALSLLAHCPHVHLIATCDHVHTPLLWNEQLLARFKWVWHDATTFEPYREEVQYETAQVVSGDQSRTLTLSSVSTVVSSLTPNARGIFEVLARHQLEQEDDSSYKGLELVDLYRMCRSKFLVNSDIALKTQLTEFQDHKLIRYIKDSNGAMMVTVLVEPAILREFVDREYGLTTTE